MKVERGQWWRHVPSGDVRAVHSIVPFHVAAGFARWSDAGTNYEREHGSVGARVARMVMVSDDGFIRNDRRDSSDMVLRHRMLAGLEWSQVEPSDRQRAAVTRMLALMGEPGPEPDLAPIVDACDQCGRVITGAEPYNYDRMPCSHSWALLATMPADCAAQRRERQYR